VASRGGVEFGVYDSSSRPASLNLWSCGGIGLVKALLGLDECGAGVADRDGHELHLSTYSLQGGNQRGVLNNNNNDYNNNWLQHPNNRGAKGYAPGPAMVI